MYSNAQYRPIMMLFGLIKVGWSALIPAVTRQRLKVKSPLYHR